MEARRAETIEFRERRWLKAGLGSRQPGPRQRGLLTPHLLIRAYQFHVGNTEGLCQFEERNDRWITLPLLQAADVLLAKARYLGQFLLREAVPFPDPPNIPAYQFAHIHAQRSAHYIL